MADNTIEAIRDAERESLSREKEARTKAAQIVDEARAGAKTTIADAVTALKESDEAEMRSVDAEGEKLMEKAIQEATDEIGALREKAGKNEKAAVDAVLAYLTKGA